jgi:hypothetical protein
MGEAKPLSLASNIAWSRGQRGPLGAFAAAVLPQATRRNRLDGSKEPHISGVKRPASPHTSSPPLMVCSRGQQPTRLNDQQHHRCQVSTRHWSPRDESVMASAPRLNRKPRPAQLLEAERQRPHLNPRYDMEGSAKTERLANGGNGTRLTATQRASIPAS